MDNPTCEDRIDGALSSRLEDLRQLWDAYREDPEQYVDDLGNLYEYGLAADYVAPGTFDDQDEGFFRYQISYGGPSDEFRFYVSPHRWGLAPYRVEYRFHDWFDGAGRDLEGESFDLLRDIFDALFPDPNGTVERAS